MFWRILLATYRMTFFADGRHSQRARDFRRAVVFQHHISVTAAGRQGEQAHERKQ